MLSNFSWVVPGQIAGSAAPKGNAEEVIDALHGHGIKTIVNLTEVESVHHAAYEAAGIRSVHIAVPDFAAPTEAQLADFHRLVDDAAAHPLLVHCRMGIGRTGTFLAVAIVAMVRNGSIPAAEIPGGDYVAHLRSMRPKSLQVPEQVLAFEAYLRNLRS